MSCSLGCFSGLDVLSVSLGRVGLDVFNGCLGSSSRLDVFKCFTGP